MIVDSLDPWVDIWLAETLSSLAEYRSVVAALERSEKPLWVSFSVSDEPEDQGRRLRSGELLDAVFREVSRGPAKAMLFNCSQPENISGAMSMVSANGDFGKHDIRTGAYANTFTPRPKDAEANSDDAELRSEIDPTHYLDFVNSWLDSGASIVGGCCGIGPEHIRSMHRSLRL
jgi:homocysteine S-methyltransferase